MNMIRPTSDNICVAVHTANSSGNILKNPSQMLFFHKTGIVFYAENNMHIQIYK